MGRNDELQTTAVGAFPGFVTEINLGNQRSWPSAHDFKHVNVHLRNPPVTLNGMPLVEAIQYHRQDAEKYVRHQGQRVIEVPDDVGGKNQGNADEGTDQGGAGFGQDAPDRPRHFPLGSLQQGIGQPPFAGAVGCFPKQHPIRDFRAAALLAVKHADMSEIVIPAIQRAHEAKPLVIIPEHQGTFPEG